MTRYLAIASLGFIAMAVGMTSAGQKSKDYVVKGTFTKDDPKDQARGGPSQTHSIAMAAGTRYTIDLVKTSEYDPYLRLLDPKGNQIDEDDDSGGDLNSRIIFNCTKDGDYKIVCTTFGANMYGGYTLTVKTAGAVQQPVSAHAQMVTKPAPDLQADFALNGKAGKLSDLKDKLVLLYFWDVRSGTCAALLPKLNEWQKTYKKDGLTVVGVTYYTSEIGQRLRFDPDEGKLVTAKEANRASDQAMLKAFAEHHKLDHLQWVLSKADALQAYEAYVVNGVPQMVLIDRKGSIRFIDINGEKGSANFEGEIKKLLGEK